MLWAPYWHPCRRADGLAAHGVDVGLPVVGLRCLIQGGEVTLGWSYYNQLYSGRTVWQGQSTLINAAQSSQSLVNLCHQAAHSPTHHRIHSLRSIGLRIGPESHSEASALVTKKAGTSWNGASVHQYCGHPNFCTSYKYAWVDMLCV